MALAPYSPNQASARAKETWQRFSSGFTPGQKAVTLAALVGLVAASAFLSSHMSSPSYQPLFSGLQPSSAAAITSDLASAKVPYKLANGGTTIEVPAAKVDQERLTLAAAGLPQAGSGAGLSILDKEGITTSQFTQQADYQRAVQDELQSTIDSIQGVASSQVEIVMPSQSAFALGNAQQPSASVMVDLQPGTSLSEGQVQSIAHLVASAVPNLSANNVTVADNNGNLLFGPGAGSGPAAAMSAAQGYDSAAEASLTTMLDQIVGPGNASVRVNAVLGTASTKTSTQGIELGPKGVPIRAANNVSTSKETFNGTGTALGGVLGTNTVTPAGAGKSTYTKTSSQTSYETGVSNVTINQPPGQLQKESVSVVLSSLPRGASLAKIRQAVSAAAGLTPADTLSVVSIPFSTTLANQAKINAKAEKAALAKAQLMTEAKELAVALAIIAALVVLWRKSRKGPALQAQPSVEYIPGPELSPTAPQTLAATEEEKAPEIDYDVASRVLRAWLDEVPSNNAGAN